MSIADNFDQFVDRVSEAERVALNSPAGQELTKKLLEMKLEQNPDMTPEEWSKTKSEFMTFMFFALVKESPELMSELAGHVWTELRAEDEPTDPA